MTLDSNIGSFTYAGLPLSNMHIKANLSGPNAEGTLQADNSWLKANLDFSAQQQAGRISGSLDGSITSLRLSQLTGDDSNADLRLMADIHLKGFYEDKAQKMAVGGTIDNLNAVDSRLGYPGGSIRFGLGTSPDSTHIYLNSGDLTLMSRAEEPLEQLISDFSNVSNELTSKLSAAQLNHNTLRLLLPDMKMRLHAGSNNPLHQMMMANGFRFDTLSATMTTNTATGINATANIANLRTGAVLLERTHLTIKQDSDALRLNASIENTSKKNPNRFKATLNGSLLSDGFSVMANFKDDKGREGINIGTRATLDGHGGISFTLMPRVSTLAYRQFKVNEDNYLRMDSAGFFNANIDLLADDNTNLKLLSINQDSINQDITLSLANLNLHDLSSVVPFMPSVSGWLDGDIHVIKTPQSLTAVGQLQSRKLEYEGLYIGEIGTELFYMPEDDGHYVVAQILSEDKEVAVLDGHYYERHGGTLDATLSLDQFPVALLNTFLSALSGILAFALYARVVRVNNRYRSAQMGILALMAATALLLRMTPVTIILYGCISAFATAFYSTPFLNAYWTVLEKLPELDVCRPETHAVREYFCAGGRVLGILLTMLLPATPAGSALALFLITAVQYGALLLSRGIMRDLDGQSL